MARDSIIGMDAGSADFPLDRSKIRELVLALGEVDPVYTDSAAALDAGFDAVPAPLTWPVFFGHWADDAAFIARLGVDLRRVLHGETTWEYVRPAVAGDEIHVERTVVEETTRQGKRGGSMRLIKMCAVFTDAGGEVVARQYDTLIETGA